MILGELNVAGKSQYGDITYGAKFEKARQHNAAQIMDEYRKWRELLEAAARVTHECTSSAQEAIHMTLRRDSF